MIGFLENFRGIRSHYRAFGPGGVSFLYNKNVRRNSLINIRVPGFAHPIFLRNSTEDIPMFYHIFLYKEYDVECDGTPEVILDCGAHIGLNAIFFANKFPAAKIFCVEPEKSNFDILLKNTLPYPNIKCLNNGIWNTTTHLKIVDHGLGNWGFVTEEADHPDSDTIAAISIDDIMSRYGLKQIDLCKINIEGTEKELFEKNYESWLSKTKLITIELHDSLRAGCSKAFFKAMVNYNFSLSQKGPYLVVGLTP